MQGTINVIARFRPPRDSEKGKGKVCYMEPDETSFKTQANHQIVKKWVFNRVYYPESTQQQVYNTSVKHMIDMFMQGYNATIFAYGQTGSGKTYTMIGPSGQEEDPVYSGISPRAMRDIFDYIQNAPDTDEFNIKLSFVEIYNEHVADLLNVGKNDMRLVMGQNGEVNIADCTEITVSSATQMMNLYNEGAKRRRTAETKMNKHSSRSHSILRIKMTRKDQKGTIFSSILNLIDLAGSERVERSKVEGQGFEEAKNINMSLLTLGKVINALANIPESEKDSASKGPRASKGSELKQSGYKHIPYRESKLTRLLQSSLSGNSLVLVVINLSSDGNDLSETNSSIQFGMRASTIRTNPRKNEDYTKEQLLKKLREAHAIIAQLRALLKENGIDVDSMIEIPGTMLLGDGADGQGMGIDLKAVVNKGGKGGTGDLSNGGKNKPGVISLSDLITPDSGIVNLKPISTIIMENRNGNIFEKIAALEQSLKDSEMEVYNLNERLQDYEDEIADLRKEKLENDKKLEEKKESISAKDSELEQLRNMYEQSMTQLRLEAEKVQTLQSSYDALKERYEKARVILLKVQEKLPIIEKRAGKSSSGTETSSEEFIDPLANIDKLTLENNQLKANIKRLQDENMKLKMERDILNTSLIETVTANQRIIAEKDAKLNKYSQLVDLIAYNPNQVDEFIRGGKRGSTK